MNHTDGAAHSLFNFLVLSLLEAAVDSLGGENIQRRSVVDLEKAKSHIEMIEMLETKTRNNLDPDEKRLLTQILYDLRLRFLEAKKLAE